MARYSVLVPPSVMSLLACRKRSVRRANSSLGSSIEESSSRSNASAAKLRCRSCPRRSRCSSASRSPRGFCSGNEISLIAAFSASRSSKKATSGQRNDTVCRVFLELRLGRLFCLFEQHCRSMRDAGGLEHNQLARGDRLADFNDVGLNRLWKGPL